MPRVVHFEIPTDDADRAVKFYAEVFGWTAQKWDGPQDYWLLTTGQESEPGIDGAITPRDGSELFSTPVNTVDVSSVDEAAAKVAANGGEIVAPKMAVPGVGYMAYFRDPDGNLFGMMQSDPSAS